MTKRRPDPENAPPTVFIVDDDNAVRESLSGLFQSVGLCVKAYPSTHAMLTDEAFDRPGCLVLDIRLPGQSGLDFFDALVERGVDRPVVFISGHADVPMAVRAMKAGALEVLTKPVRSQELLDVVHAAIEKDRAKRAEARGMVDLIAVFGSLTPREREIMALVVTGRRNKQIAADVGLSEATVKLHRSQVMRKMNAGSVADLVRMTATLGAAGLAQPRSTKG